MLIKVVVILSPTLRSIEIGMENHLADILMVLTPKPLQLLNIGILAFTTRSDHYLSTLEALFIWEIAQIEYQG